jgi:hypothetical protein
VPSFIGQLPTTSRCAGLLAGLFAVAVHTVGVVRAAYKYMAKAIVHKNVVSLARNCH